MIILEQLKFFEHTIFTADKYSSYKIIITNHFFAHQFQTFFFITLILSNNTIPYIFILRWELLSVMLRLIKRNPV